MGLGRSKFSLRLGAIFLACTAGGCSNFCEKHYFETLDQNKKPVNYFRLTVTGYTLLSSSRYVSGYFDEEAVNQYFGTVSQPAGAEFSGDKPDKAPAATDPAAKPNGTPTAAVAGAAPAAATTASTGPAVATQSLGAGPQSRGSLVLLLSSNSDAIANNIGALAQSQDTLSAVTMLANRDKIQAVSNAQTALAEEQDRAAAIKSLGVQIVDQTLKDGDDKATAERELLTLLNNIASQYGNDVAFTTLDDAAKWLDRKRATLLRP